MKFEKPNGTSLKQSVASVIGAGGGAMVSRVIVAAATAPKDGVIATEKEENNKLIGQGVAAVAGIAGVAAVKGDDTVTNAVRGAFFGMAVINTLDLISGLVKKDPKTSAKLAEPNQKYFRTALGLGCPCQDQPALNRPALRMPEIRVPYIYQSETRPIALAMPTIDEAWKMAI